MPPNRFESEVESFLEGSHGDRTHIKRADHPRLHHYAGRYFSPHRTQPRCNCETAITTATTDADQRETAITTATTDADQRETAITTARP